MQSLYETKEKSFDEIHEVITINDIETLLNINDNIYSMYDEFYRQMPIDYNPFLLNDINQSIIKN